MTELLKAIKNFLISRFNLDEDKADENLIIDTITRDVHFKGTNLWTLIFAILIASIGLNVNSTAVIIGAMLISPLMGPIMGIGLGIAIIDLQLMKRGIKNILIAAVFSIATSSLYFSLTPLQEVNSELLARTTPSLWDVFIAFFGGLAGIIAGTRKEKSNVLPGVAIATALMPPLCTAGFGIAEQNWMFFLGALYLFFINCLFICLASFIIVRFLKFKNAKYTSTSVQKRVIRTIWIITILTIIPSVYLAFRIVQEAIFEQNARKFVQNEFRFEQTQVVSRSVKFSRDHPQIDLLLVGQEISQHEIDSLRRRMRLYKLDSNSLVIHQGLNARKEIDIAQIKASVLEDVFASQHARDTVKSEEIPNATPPDLRPEIKALYPDISEFSLTSAIIRQVDTLRADTVMMFVAKSPRYFTLDEKARLGNWLKQRIPADSVKLLLEEGK